MELIARADRLLARLVTVVAVGAMAVALVAGWVGPVPAPAWRTWVGAGLAVALALTLSAGLPRRGGAADPARPGWVLVTIALLTTLLCLAAPVTQVGFVPYVAAFVIVRARDLATAAPLLLPPLAGQAYLMHVVTRDWRSVVVNLGLVLVMVLAVDRRRREAESRELEAARAAALAMERGRAEAAERQRDIAARMHDVLAHSLSGLTVSLQVAGLQARQEGVSEALQQRLSAATELAQEGLRGARDAVAALTDPAETDAPALEEWLGVTIDRLRAATGLEARVSGSVADVPPDRTEVVRAVLQEALTNSVRHAPGFPVTISLSRDDIQVVSRGDLASAPPTTQPSGHHGITGLRRRVEASGGRLTAGPVADGWQVRAEWGP